MTAAHAGPDALRRGRRAVRPGARARGARRARHGLEDVLRLRRRPSAPPPNSQVCPTCLGLPGSLPVLNAGGRRVDRPRRARPRLRHRDLVPLRAQELLLPGHAEELPDLAVRRADLRRRAPRRRGRRADGTSTVRVEIERAHMEEDTGKSLHVGGATGRIHGADYSLVDYNRAGIPLIEIVTKPVEGTGALAPEVAAAYVTELRELMRTLGVSDVRMEQGSLRCDVNVSLRRSPGDPLGTRSETKNVNSLRSVERAVRYEISPSGGAARRRRPGRAGDPALARGHRRHHARAVQGAGRGLPLLPRARPRAGRARAGVGRGAARDAARAARRAAPAPAGGSGGSPTSTCSRWSTPVRSTWSRQTVAAGRAARGGPQVVAGRAGPPRQRARRRARVAADHPRAGGPGASSWSTPAR